MNLGINLSANGTPGGMQYCISTVTDLDTSTVISTTCYYFSSDGFSSVCSVDTPDIAKLHLGDNTIILSNGNYQQFSYGGNIVNDAYTLAFNYSESAIGN